MTLISSNDWGLTSSLAPARLPNSEFRIPKDAGMIPLDPLPNLIDQVYARILEAIIDRSLPPGHRIRQNELAEKLGVSRQPVSHALHLLHRHGPAPPTAPHAFSFTPPH